MSYNPKIISPIFYIEEECYQIENGNLSASDVTSKLKKLGFGDMQQGIKEYANYKNKSE